MRNFVRLTMIIVILAGLVLTYVDSKKEATTTSDTIITGDIKITNNKFYENAANAKELTLSSQPKITNNEFHENASNSKDLIVKGELKISGNKLNRNQNCPESGGLYLSDPLTITEATWYENYNPAKIFMPEGWKEGRIIYYRADHSDKDDNKYYLYRMWWLTTNKNVLLEQGFFPCFKR